MSVRLVPPPSNVLPFRRPAVCSCSCGWRVPRTILVQTSGAIAAIELECPECGALLSLDLSRRASD